jgi:hypothetical protein
VVVVLVTGGAVLVTVVVLVTGGRVVVDVTVVVLVVVTVLVTVVVEVLVIVTVGGAVVVVGGGVVVVGGGQVTVKDAYGYHSVTHWLLGLTVHPLGPFTIWAYTTSLQLYIGPSAVLPLPVM